MSLVQMSVAVEPASVEQKERKSAFARFARPGDVRMIAQGSSERNISFVTDSEHKTRAINVLHQAFFEEPFLDH